MGSEWYAQRRGNLPHQGAQEGVVADVPWRRGHARASRTYLRRHPYAQPRSRSASCAVLSLLAFMRAVREERAVAILREPTVHIVGRQSVDSASVAHFLDEHGTTWETDSEVGGELLSEMGGRLCYMSFGAKQGRRSNADYIGNILEQRHGSVLEHAVWTLLITGVSRSLTHELIRHRAASASRQLSQRYVDEAIPTSWSRRSSPPIPSCTRSGWRPWSQRSAPTWRSPTGWLSEAEGGAAGVEAAPRGARRRARRRAACCRMPRRRRSSSPPTRVPCATSSSCAAASMPSRRSASWPWPCCGSCGEESPNIFGDFTLEPLPDGSLATSTPNSKV